MIVAIVVGGILGAVTIEAMRRTGMLQERSGLAVLVAAIALFYPVFAFQTSTVPANSVFHVAVFLGFGVFGALGFWWGSALLAWALIAHGLFDVVMHFTGHPGPIWWPAFCASVDLVAGGLVLWHLRRKRIPS